MLFSRLGPTTLYVADLERALAFYQRVCGLHVVERRGGSIARLAIAQDAPAGLELVGLPPGVATPRGQLALRVSDGQAGLEALGRAAVAAGTSIVGGWGFGLDEMLCLLDPEGHQVVAEVDRAMPSDREGPLATRYVGPSRPGTLVLVLHGRGGGLENMAALPAGLDRPGVAYLFLNAPFPLGRGLAWDPPGTHAPDLTFARELVLDVLDGLVEQGWDSRDLALLGFSQGGTLAIDVALRYDRPLAGVATLNAPVPSPEGFGLEASPHARSMAWLLTHGLADPVVPIESARAGAAALRAAGVPVAWHELDKRHEVAPALDLPLLDRWLDAFVRTGPQDARSLRIKRFKERLRPQEGANPSLRL